MEARQHWTQPTYYSYNCGNLGHLACDCHSRRTSESSGRTLYNAHREDKIQVPRELALYSRRQNEQPLEADDSHEDPLTYLYSSDDSHEVHQVRVSDRGSKPCRARVLVQDVPVEGVIDTGAVITIMEGNLFKKVASVGQLRKCDFKKLDKVPLAYNNQKFLLDGRMDLDITFSGKTMRTPVYT